MTVPLRLPRHPAARRTRTAGSSHSVRLRAHGASGGQCDSGGPISTAAEPPPRPACPAPAATRETRCQVPLWTILYPPARRGTLAGQVRGTGPDPKGRARAARPGRRAYGPRPCPAPHRQRHLARNRSIRPPPPAPMRGHSWYHPLDGPGVHAARSGAALRSAEGRKTVRRGSGGARILVLSGSGCRAQFAAAGRREWPRCGSWLAGVAWTTRLRYRATSSRPN